MTGVEILLLVIGVVFFVASFFIAEKLSPSELGKIGELSNEEIQKVMERELQRATASIGSRVEEKVEEVLVKTADSMENECNDKIKAIGEYSDTVIESMNKTHNEIMFLYSMLNDKHAELTQFSSKLQELSSEIAKKDEEIQKHLVFPVKVEEVQPPKPAGKPGRKPKAKAKEKEKAPEKVEIEAEEGLKDVLFEEFNAEIEADDREDFNHNEEILKLHKQGKSAIEIARELALGLGEVQLVIGLYEGNRKK
ncbi:DUF6115 domain-containing protein [Roseburia sp. 1XD42-69]|jgi:hypothetical protein|uniref:DUF6115 domain-containing protein n=1 Tax=Roseburia sp. 1XD42-69 TaxID=2320088 RepID=UPI000EA11EBD|nr:DUF6115 domain-containing protein [Roseburia sp. 1XD42-69]RKJ68320.1 hypothetical protein D7Y06_02910 [Roseburia sp. 1XD42-69]